MRVVGPGHGVRWARAGLEVFAAAPATWVGIAVLFVLVGVVLGVIPFASMLFSVAIPIHVGGLMLGCEALRQGGRLEIRHLFTGFEQPHLQPLALVGALYLAGSLIVMLPAIALLVMGMMTTAAVGAVSPRAGIGALLVLGTVVLLIVIATVLLSMAVWFAPALVVFRGVAPLEALKLSLRAALRNLLPFLVYVVAMLAIGVIALSPLMAAIFLAAAGRDAPGAGPMMVVLFGGTGLFALCCLLVAMPVTWGAMYASYRDIFGE